MWAETGSAPIVMRGKADLQEASLILTSVKPELMVGGTLQTRTMLAPFGCEEVKVMHGKEEDQSAGRLVVSKLSDGVRDEKQGPSSSGKNPRRDDGQGRSRQVFKQIRAPPCHVKERAYPKQVTQEGDVQRYGGMKMIRKEETIFAAYDKAEMRKAKILIVVNSDFVHTSKSLFWPDVIMLAAVDLDLMQSVSMAIGLQRQTEMNSITIVFAGINDHLQRRGFLSRLREPTTAEDAVWPVIKDKLESMGEAMDTLK